MREKINLQELTTLLSDKAKISKREADAFLREFFGLMTDSLIEDKQVKIRNLGTFKLTEVENRESVNVRTGERVLIPAHTKVSYIQDKTLGEIINERENKLESEIIEDAPSSEITNISKKEVIKQDEFIIPEIEKQEEGVEEDYQEEENLSEETTKLKDSLFLNMQDESEETVNEHKRHVKIIIVTFFTVAILIAIFYFLSRENSDASDFIVEPAKTAFDLAQEEANSKVFYGETGEKINPADTVIPIKQTWVQGKKRKTKVAERLTSIAFDEYGDVAFWIYLYEENKHIISKDNYVKAGIDIIIPPPEKYDIDAKSTTSLQKAREFSRNYSKNNQK